MNLELLVAQKARWILSQTELEQHAYMDSKGFPDMRVNVWRKSDQASLMVVPMFFDGELCGCQLIGIDGTKRFLTGQRTNDAVFSFDARGPVFLCEGFATAVSLRAVLAALKRSYTINACFSAGTPEGKAISKMNAVNYSLREVLRESARNNRQLLVYIRAVFAELDTSQCPPPDWDEARERMDVLLSNAKQAMEQR